jgi:hypothetical protein
MFFEDDLMHKHSLDVYFIYIFKLKRDVKNELTGHQHFRTFCLQKLILTLIYIFIALF